MIHCPMSGAPLPGDYRELAHLKTGLIKVPEHLFDLRIRLEDDHCRVIHRDRLQHTDAAIDCCKWTASDPT